MKYISTPFIPDDKISAVILDFRADDETVKSLTALNISVIPTCKINCLQTPVCGHTDMMIHHLYNNKFVVANEAYEHFSRLLPNASLIKGQGKLSCKYPYDILYNTAVLGDMAICNAKFTANEILNEYDKILNVKQGYTKCSICIISDNAIITADKKIAQTCVANGIDVLKIDEGHVELKGMSYGFFGGASGLISKNLLAVNGELNTHKNCNEIISFCKKHNVDITELKKGALNDVGSILPLYYD